MTKNMKALACLGVVAVLGATTLPLGAYAATEAKTEDTDDVTINADVVATISIEATAGTIEFKDQTGTGGTNTTIVPGGDIVTNDGTINVKCNNPDGYVLKIKGADGSTYASEGTKYMHLTGKTAGNTDFIQAGTPTTGSSAWGIQLSTDVKKKDNSTSPIAATWSGDNYGAVTDTNQEMSNVDKASEADGDDYTVTAGISAAFDLQPDTYSGTVTITAVSNVD